MWDSAPDSEELGLGESDWRQETPLTYVMIEGLREELPWEPGLLAGALFQLASSQATRWFLVTSCCFACTLQGTHWGPHSSSGGEPLVSAHSQADRHIQTLVNRPAFLTLEPLIQQTVSRAPGSEDNGKWQICPRRVHQHSLLSHCLWYSSHLGNTGHTVPECYHFSLPTKNYFSRIVTPTSYYALSTPDKEKCKTKQNFIYISYTHPIYQIFHIYFLT